VGQRSPPDSGLSALETRLRPSGRTIPWPFTSLEARTVFAEIYPITQTNLDRVLSTFN
jgi:hypothetical protein